MLPENKRAPLSSASPPSQGVGTGAASKSDDHSASDGTGATTSLTPEDLAELGRYLDALQPNMKLGARPPSKARRTRDAFLSAFKQKGRLAYSSILAELADCGLAIIREYFSRFKEDVTAFNLKQRDLKTRTFDGRLFDIDTSNGTTIRLRPLPALADPWAALLAACQKENSRISTDLAHRYSHELYVPRKHAQREFRKFLRKPKQLFLLVGKSGYGKTNLLCELVRRHGRQYPVLLFRGEYYHHESRSFLLDIKKALLTLSKACGAKTTDDLNTLAEENASLIVIFLSFRTFRL